ncbi:dihydrofolate reductase [Verticillium dahliae VdLs.17]|uniref:Dihydrofolate reductase n=1 Tax=Verticillium dahliae (strain VdLs.17 / ATCC MYA-4575 / FGSC 10137) TaxID=498257 RepID=G2WWV8_VERDV|nr:dihydrofolate reductase [Verticillium dahliae VdLs.17]EGY21213.1 dihydrofolate reductase [Verticillium dahliae VdLs.17]
MLFGATPLKKFPAPVRLIIAYGINSAQNAMMAYPLNEALFNSTTAPHAIFQIVQAPGFTTSDASSSTPPTSPATSRRRTTPRTRRRRTPGPGSARRDNLSDADRQSYIGLDEGMAAIASTLRSSGPVDAVLGFSQGGAVAALVAAALETPHRDVHAEQAAWVAALREANEGRGLRFAAVYSGFFAVDESLAWCFEPKIQTPTIQFIGSLDTVVDEGRSRALVDRCEEAAVVVHPGGHYVPISKEWAMALAGYVKHHAQDPEAAKM